MTQNPFILSDPGNHLDAALRRFGTPDGGWLDLSTTMTPFPYPVPSIDPSLLTRPPCPQAEEALRQAAKARYGVADDGHVAVLPGSRAAMGLLPRIWTGARVAVVGVWHDDLVRAWERTGHRVGVFETLERAADADIVWLANPDPVDGRRHAPANLAGLARKLAERGGILVVDESLADLYPEESAARLAGPGLLVLRGVDSFFGLAGLGLAFAIADAPVARLLRQTTEGWSANAAALAIGRTVLDDLEWSQRAIRRLSVEALELDSLLVRAGLAVAGGTALFRLASAPRAWVLYEHLGQRGILVRAFASAPRWLRLGLPPNEAGRERLARALADWQGG